MAKVAPSAQLREQIAAFLKDAGSIKSGAAALSELVGLATRRVVQEALEQEQTDFIGRERYVRTPGHGKRDGYIPAHLDTAEGRLGVQVPQVREAETPYRSQLYAFLRGHSDVVERLAIEMWARGLSTRDVEAAFTDEQGVCLLSRTAVSELTEALWEEYEAFQQRSLGDVPIFAVFLDGVYEPLRAHGIAREAVLVAWAITLEGKKILLSLALGNRESHEAWRDFLRDLVARGLPVPLTVTTDGAPGLIRAVAEVWPESLRLRCWVHKMRNLETKVPAERWLEVKAELVAIRDAATLAAGEQAAQAFLARYRGEFPAACKALSEDLPALLNHLRLPWRLRKFLRTTNLCERSFEEERRRSKVLPRFFTEKSCLKLVFATLLRAAARWQRIAITPLELQQLQLLYQERGLVPAMTIGQVA
jgi:transposase-like protein